MEDLSAFKIALIRQIAYLQQRNQRGRCYRYGIAQGMVPAALIEQVREPIHDQSHGQGREHGFPLSGDWLNAFQFWIYPAMNAVVTMATSVLTTSAAPTAQAIVLQKAEVAHNANACRYEQKRQVSKRCWTQLR